MLILVCPTFFISFVIFFPSISYVFFFPTWWRSRYWCPDKSRAKTIFQNGFKDVGNVSTTRVNWILPLGYSNAHRLFKLFFSFLLLSWQQLFCVAHLITRPNTRHIFKRSPIKYLDAAIYSTWISPFWANCNLHWVYWLRPILGSNNGRRNDRGNFKITNKFQLNSWTPFCSKKCGER